MWKWASWPADPAPHRACEQEGAVVYISGMSLYVPPRPLRVAHGQSHDQHQNVYAIILSYLQGLTL